jgi:hypothetical protein
MPDAYISQFSGEEIDSTLRAAQIISGASTLAELREKLEIRGDTIPVSAEDSTLISEALTKIPTTSGGGINPNLLDNWYFGNPVNQRGQTEYSTTGYTVDRWKLDVGGAVTLEDGCICLKKSGTYWGEYFADFDQFIGMTLTGSVLLSDGTLRTGSFVYNGSVNQAQTFFSSELGFYIQKLSDSQTQCEINSLVDNVKIKAIKLELGDTQTLAHKENEKWVLNEIPDFGEQLRRCQRYLVKLGSSTGYEIVGTGTARNSSTCNIVVPIPVTMRAVPAAILSGRLVLRNSDDANPVCTSVVVDANGVGAMYLACTANVTAGASYDAYLAPGNYLYLGADL